jgi:O-acetylhomoserine (thiol)-lyase
MERHVANTQAVAQWLEARPEVNKVHYASLDSSPNKALADKYFPKGVGGVLSFELKGDTPEHERELGQKFVSALKLHSHVANIGDVRSLVIHPASTTHSQLTAAEQASAGVMPGLVRLAIGLESLPDILADLELGFAAIH